MLGDALDLSVAALEAACLDTTDAAERQALFASINILRRRKTGRLHVDGRKRIEAIWARAQRDGKGIREPIQQSGDSIVL